MENQEDIIKWANDIDIDARAGKDGKAVKTEAKKARRVTRNPDEIPDAPPSVLAGQIPEPVEVDEDDPQQGGLSGPGSFEAAMMLFGPPMQGAPNPHGQHEVTEEG